MAKPNQCSNCKYGKSMWKEGVFRYLDRFYMTCKLLDGNEITPCLHDFIATCGCESWESGAESNV